MADFHTKTFYGQKTSLTISSPSRVVPYIFLSCINKKEDGVWENISEGEGKTVRMSIEEIICILEVLNRKSVSWRGYHVFKAHKTEIYASWEDPSRQVLQIKIGSNTKKLRFPNLNFITLMLDHILNEKIENATSGTYDVKDKDKSKGDEENEYILFSEHITASDGLPIIETTEYGVPVDIIEIKAKIKVESPKALLIKLESGEEFFIPKNTVHSEYNINEKGIYQKFLIDKWIIEKNQILS